MGSFLNATSSTSSHRWNRGAIRKYRLALNKPTRPRCFTPAGLSNRSYPDAHHPRHSHESHSFHPFAGQLATHSDHGPHHGIWRVSSLFASRDITRVCSAAAPLLAALFLTLACYVALTQLAKVWLLRNPGSDQRADICGSKIFSNGKSPRKTKQQDLWSELSVPILWSPLLASARVGCG